MGRLTWEKPNGDWGINGHSFKEVPRNLYGFICKFHEYEKSGLEPNEVMDLKERQKPKAPDIWGDGCDNEGNVIYNMYDCPNCGKSYEIDYHDYKHCPECGQAIDRSNFKSL